ncbi:hypothetical protein G9C98_006293 [Cotesia typhae]|uniref:Uncharacterized protein n=1 Tax=Cotesia typhae TaxID=2053667 RepID=A0A8J5US06_9HYME|nr:hypothetical protein G9C98_006293 [Cotesia typhae]
MCSSSGSCKNHPSPAWGHPHHWPRSFSQISNGSSQSNPNSQETAVGYKRQPSKGQTSEERPHTISSPYEKGGHKRPALSVYTFQAPDSTGMSQPTCLTCVCQNCSGQPSLHTTKSW